MTEKGTGKKLWAHSYVLLDNFGIALAFAFASKSPCGMHLYPSSTKNARAQPYPHLLPGTNCTLFIVPNNVCPRQQPSERNAHPRASLDPPRLAALLISDEVSCTALDSMRPHIPRISREYDDAPLWQVQVTLIILGRVIFGPRSPPKAHRARAAKADPDDAVPKSAKQVNMRRDSLAWLIQVQDCLSGANGCVRWRE